MNPEIIQSERRYRAIRAKESCIELIEELRMIHVLTQSLVSDEGDTETTHPDVLETDTILRNSQVLADHLARLCVGAQISGQPGGSPEFIERQEII